MAINYTYRYRKIIAEAEDISVYALLKHIKGRCLSPLQIDPRKGALVFWRDEARTADHTELKIKQNEHDSFEHWVNALRSENPQVLPVVRFSRRDSEGEHFRYAVARSRSAYGNEEENYAGIWMPTKAFKANSMCYRAVSEPTSNNEKLDDLIQQVNQYLVNYSDWENGENYALTVKASETGGEEKTLIENMFLGSGYNLCSEIARSHITVVLRKMETVRRFQPDIDVLDEVSSSEAMKVSFVSNSDY
jgi:hypothetical protein